MSLPSDYPIEGDGISENLFYFLWSKDDMEKGPMLHIPETVIFRMKQPIAWYFTSVNGQIKRKNRNNLTVTKIEEIFCRKKLSSDIVACFIETNPEQTGGTAVFNYYNMDTFLKWLQSDDKKDGILQQFIEPCGNYNNVIKCQWSPKMCLIERRQALYPLTDNRYNIYERTVTYEGNPHNSKLLPVKGSLLPSLLQQICNNIVNHITETSYNKYNISTFTAHFKVDSKDRLWFLYSTSINLTGNNNNNNNNNNNEMNSNNYLGSKTRNIQSATTFGSIYSPKPSSSMKKTKSTQQLFAQDQSQSQLRLNSQESQQQSQLQRIPPQKSAVLTIPKSVNLKGSNPYYKATNLERSYQCPTCGDFVEESCVHPVLYKLIIKYHGVLTKQMNKTYGKVEYPISDEIKETVGKIGLFEIPRDKDDQPPENFDKIPPPIRFIHPKLSYNNYVKYCKDPLFLFKSVGICEECFLKYAEYSDGSMPKPEPSPSIYSDSQLSKEELKAIRERRLESLKDKSLWSPLFSQETNSNTQTKSKYSGPTTEFGKMATKRPTIPPSNTDYITNTHYQSSSNLNTANSNNRYNTASTAGSSSYYEPSTAGTYSSTANGGKRSCSLPSIPSATPGTANNNNNNNKSKYVYKGGRVDSPMVFGEDEDESESDEEKQFEQYYSTYLEPPRQKQEKFYRDLYANPNLREGHPLTAIATEEVIRAQMTDGVLDPYQKPGEHLSPTEYGERRTEMLRQKLPKPLLAPQVLNDSEEKIIRKKEQRRERLEGKTSSTKKKGNTKRSKSPIEEDKYLNVQHYLEMPNTPEPRPKKNKKSTTRQQQQEQDTRDSGDDGDYESGENYEQYNEPYDERYDEEYDERPESGVVNSDLE